MRASASTSTYGVHQHQLFATSALSKICPQHTQGRPREPSHCPRPLQPFPRWVAKDNDQRTHSLDNTPSTDITTMPDPPPLQPHELPPKFYYNPTYGGIAGSMQNGYFVPDIAITKGDRTRINTFDRPAPPGNGPRVADHFLADIPGRPVTKDDPEVKWLFGILQKIAETTTTTQKPKLEEAMKYMDGTNPWGKMHYALGWLDDDLPQKADGTPVDNGTRVDSRCKRCTDHGLPCISRGFVDTDGQLQVYHQ